MMKMFVVTLFIGSLLFLSGCGAIAKGLGKAVRGGSKAAGQSAPKTLRNVPPRTPAVVPVPISASDDVAAQSGRRASAGGQSADDATSLADEAAQFGAEQALEFGLSNDDE